MGLEIHILSHNHTTAAAGGMGAQTVQRQLSVVRKLFTTEYTEIVAYKSGTFASSCRDTRLGTHHNGFGGRWFRSRSWFGGRIYRGITPFDQYPMGSSHVDLQILSVVRNTSTEHAASESHTLRGVELMELQEMRVQVLLLLMTNPARLVTSDRHSRLFGRIVLCSSSVF